MIEKGKWHNEFIWNPSICECDKSCDVGEYLDYANCNGKKGLIDKLVFGCEENILNAIPLNATDFISITDKK